MPVTSQSVLVRVSGEFAVFTRPEMKVERVSYDVITPSAARGILEAVLWKPQMRWVVRRITVLSPVRFISFRRNEVSTKIPSDVVQWAQKNRAPRMFFADDDRQQRNAVMLRDVDYRIEAVIELTDRAGPDDTVTKFVEMFTRRVGKGQHFHQPYLGCREFPATVRPADGSESSAEVLKGEQDLGWILHDIEYVDGRPRQPRFFHAVMRNGVIDVPPYGGEVLA